MAVYMQEHRDQVTKNVRDQIRRHLPSELNGPVGDSIGNALVEVREYHWKDAAVDTETWAYELQFDLEGEPLVLRKQFTLDRIVTDKKLNDGTYAIPYSNILGCLILTDDEVAVLATAL